MIAAPRPVTPLGILATKLEHLTEQIEADNSVDPNLKAQLRQANELASGLDPYINRCTTAESPASPELNAQKT